MLMEGWLLYKAVALDPYTYTKVSQPQAMDEGKLGLVLFGMNPSGLTKVLYSSVLLRFVPSSALAKNENSLF